MLVLKSLVLCKSSLVQHLSETTKQDLLCLMSLSWLVEVILKLILQLFGDLILGIQIIDLITGHLFG